MKLDRREFLGHAAAALALPRLCAMLPSLRLAPDRALILVWLDGGMSHLDTFDCKPESSPDIRGDLASMRTPLAGVHFSEHLPLLAASMPRCVLLRSITHGEGNHDRGSHYLLTGKRPSPVLVHPALGAILASAASPAAMPPFVAIPDAPEYGGAGFLPKACQPFEVGGDPGKPDFAVRDLGVRAGGERALDLLHRVDALDSGPRSADEAARDRLQTQALAMSSPEVRARFDLQEEPAEVRERYGRHRLGQSCLLARRVVEGGARVVLVRDVGWDHHVGIKNALTYGFPPKLTALDQAIAALLHDLEVRSLDDRVLLCVASEFGRTPRLNPAGGRDHWPRAQSVLLHGAGLRRGVVVGETDARGEEPLGRALSPGDLFATLIVALGGDVQQVLHTPDGRPVRVVEEGAQPVREALP